MYDMFVQYVYTSCVYLHDIQLLTVVTLTTSLMETLYNLAQYVGQQQHTAAKKVINWSESVNGLASLMHRGQEVPRIAQVEYCHRYLMALSPAHARTRIHTHTHTHVYGYTEPVCKPKIDLLIFVCIK